MSTAELLKHVRKMSPGERKKFVRSVLALESSRPKGMKKKPRRVKWPDVEARARKIFGDRVLPNLVLMEREERPF